MYQELPIDVVRPAADNLRRRVGDVSDIVASIPTHGIIEPLVVAPQDDGTYLIVAGHRRHAAAIKAELSTVPCVVRAMTDEERVLAALIENGARNDLRATEEAGGYFRLVEAGWTIKDLAAAVGRSPRHVSTRLSLLQLPAAVRSKVDQGKVSIADATELLRLKNHPQALKEVTARLAEEDYDSDVAWTVHHALREIERQERRTAVVEELSAKGVAVIDHDGYGPPPGLALLGRYGGIELDAQAHADESCHVVVVTSNGDQHPACNDAKRHAKKGASELKITKPARVESDHDRQHKADHKALRESARERGEYLSQLLHRRLPKASVTSLVMRAFLHSANQAPAKAACDLLGIEAPNASQDYYGARAVDALVRYANDGEAQLQRTALALAFALAEEHMGASWGAIGWAQPSVLAHLEFLEASGYERSDFENDRIEQAADALEERARERQRWAERRAAQVATSVGEPGTTGDDVAVEGPIDDHGGEPPAEEVMDHSG